MSFPMGALSEIASPITRPISVLPGVSYRTIGVKWWGEGAYERETIDGSQTAAKSLSLVCEGDLIINKIWVRHGSTAIASQAVDGCAASGEFPTFELDRTKVLPRWIHWLTKSPDFWSKCDALSHGTSGKNRIRPELFLTIQIPLPSLSEQCRIVARIEELAAKFEEARRLRLEAVEETTALFEASVGSAFESLHPIEYEPLRKLTSKIGSGSTPTGGRGSYPSTGIPFIRSQNVRMRHFQWEDIAFIDKVTHDSMKGTHVKPNDVLLNITGASIGRVTCTPSNLIEANVNQHVAIIRPIEVLLSPRYLMHWLSQPVIQEFINEKQKGATRQGFTKAQIEAFEIPLPPLAEQNHIVTYLDDLQSKVDSLKQLQFETSAELDALLPSILDKAFKGEL